MTIRWWLAAVTVMCAWDRGIHAQTFELRGSGILPDVSSSAVGMPGEEITVSVMLSSADFLYIPLDNPIVHYFAPNTTIPVKIVGSVSGEYEAVSPIARFVALELENNFSGGDTLQLDVAAGTAGTSLVSLSTSGASGFNGSETPHSSEDLFSLFAGAMNDQGFWTPSSSSAVFVGSDPELLFLGQLQWTLVNPIAGDLDADGDVDGKDFLLWQRNPTGTPLVDWQKNYGLTSAAPHNVPTLPGDFNEDGQVDGRDYLAWQRDSTVGELADWQDNYGQNAALLGSLAVPEPATTTALLFSVGIALICRAFKRSQESL
jgi:hypothetical protein